MRNLLLNITKHAFGVAAAAATFLTFVVSGMAFEKVNTNSWGVAIKGYDTVAYHTENRAVKGDSSISFEWNEAKWYFTSTENRDLFAKDPERFAPRYGGY